MPHRNPKSNASSQHDYESVHSLRSLLEGVRADGGEQQREAEDELVHEVLESLRKCESNPEEQTAICTTVLMSGLPVRVRREISANVYSDWSSGRDAWRAAGIRFMGEPRGTVSLPKRPNELNESPVHKGGLVREPTQPVSSTLVAPSLGLVTNHNAAPRLSKFVELYGHLGYTLDAQTRFPSGDGGSQTLAEITAGFLRLSNDSNDVVCTLRDFFSLANAPNDTNAMETILGKWDEESGGTAWLDWMTHVHDHCEEVSRHSSSLDAGRRSFQGRGVDQSTRGSEHTRGPFDQILSTSEDKSFTKQQ